MLDRGVIWGFGVWVARRQVALVGSGHRPCAGSEARRAAQPDGGAEKAAQRWVAWLPYSLCWQLTMASSPKPL